MRTPVITVDQDIMTLEKRLRDDPSLMTAATLAKYVECGAKHPFFDLMSKVKNYSMLHVDTLLLLRLFALASRGGILEIGPYIGGSTVAIASGVRDGFAPKFLSIEPGGSYDHPEYPSKDILGDLRKNLRNEHLLQYVHLIEGRSSDSIVRDQVFEALSECGISMLFVDADGEIGRDMDIYRPLLRPNCLIVFDDYVAPGAANKEERVHSIVEEEVAKGRLEPFGVFKWGTWFGRYLGA